MSETQRDNPLLRLAQLADGYYTILNDFLFAKTSLNLSYADLTMDDLKRRQIRDEYEQAVKAFDELTTELVVGVKAYKLETKTTSLSVMRTNLLSKSWDLPDESERVLEANQAADQIGDEARGMAQSGLLVDELKVQEPDFLFAKDGDGYDIRGFGESGRLTARLCKGLDQIYRLIQSPGEEMPFLTVLNADKDDRVSGDRQSFQPTQDTQYRREVTEELRTIEAKLREAEAAGDPAAIAEARDEIEALSKRKASDIGAFGKPRDMNAGRLHSMDRSIRSSLKRAYRSMREAKPAMNELATHFEASINVRTSGVTYQPIGSAPEWAFNRAERK